MHRGVYAFRLKSRSQITNLESNLTAKAQIINSQLPYLIVSTWNKISNRGTNKLAWLLVIFLFLVTCAKLSWSHSVLQATSSTCWSLTISWRRRISSIVSYLPSANRTASQVHSKLSSYLSGSRDVVGHVTVGFPIGHFLLAVLWNSLYLQPLSGYCTLSVLRSVYGENCIIFINRFWLIHPCDSWTEWGQSDGRAVE